MPSLSHNIRNELGGASSLMTIVPDDDEDLEAITRALYVVAEGDVVVIAEDDTDAVTIPDVPAGTVLPIRVRRVTEATVATVIGLI